MNHPTVREISTLLHKSLLARVLLNQPAADHAHKFPERFAQRRQKHVVDLRPIYTWYFLGHAFFCVSSAFRLVLNTRTSPFPFFFPSPSLSLSSNLSQYSISSLPGLDQPYFSNSSAHHLSQVVESGSIFSFSSTPHSRSKSSPEIVQDTPSTARW